MNPVELICFSEEAARKKKKEAVFLTRGIALPDFQAFLGFAVLIPFYSEDL